MSFSGFISQEGTINGVLLTRDNTPSPKDADALPTFRVYGPNGFMANGSGTVSLLQTGTITGATNASPIVITSAGHGLATGARVTISGVTGNTAANGNFSVTVIDVNTFSLDGSTGNGAYVSGGSWHPTGCYRWTVAALGANGYAAGNAYDVIFSYAVSSVAKADTKTFAVV